jgi:hypothetical protein
MRSVGLVLTVAMAFVLGCGGGAPVQQAAQPITLAFKDMGGEYVDYVVDFGIDSNIEGTVTSWLATIKMAAKVDAIGGEGFERRFRFDQFTITTIATDRPEPDPNAPEYAGATLWLKTDPEGALIDWKGLDGVGGRTVDGRSFRQYIVYQLLTMLQPPPGQPVNAGSTWQRQFVMEIRTGAVNAEFTTDVDYTVEGFGVKDEHECAKIDMKIDIMAKGEGSVGGKEVNFISGAEGTGEMWFDHVNGIVVDFSTKTTTTRQTEMERLGKEDITSMSTTLDSVVEIKLAK